MVMDNSEDLYRQDAELTKYTVDREQEYVNFVLEHGDSIRRESPGVLQIRILKPKKEKK